MKQQLLIGTVLIFSYGHWAKGQVDYGFADSSIPELSQFEYYRGQWEAEIEKKGEDGQFESLPGKALIKGFFHEDQRTFQSQFSYGQGTFTTDISTFDTLAQEWKSLFLNAKAQKWHHFTSRLVDGKMTTLVIGGFSGKEDYDVKTVDQPQSGTRFLRLVYHSWDNGANWELVYRMTTVKVDG